MLGHNPQNITACLIIPFVILFSEIIKINKMTKVKRIFQNIFNNLSSLLFWSLIKFGPYS